MRIVGNGRIDGAGVGAAPRRRHAQGALEQGRLGLTDLRGITVPSRQCLILERPPIGEGELPRLRTLGVDRLQMAGGEVRTLAAREEGDARHGGWYGLAKSLYCAPADLLDGRLR